jgi:hypothetical protein
MKGPFIMKAQIVAIAAVAAVSASSLTGECGATSKADQKKKGDAAIAKYVENYTKNNNDTRNLCGRSRSPGERAGDKRNTNLDRRGGLRFSPFGR